jgi:hypothetical protein
MLLSRYPEADRTTCGVNCKSDVRAAAAAAVLRGALTRARRS